MFITENVDQMKEWAERSMLEEKQLSCAIACDKLVVFPTDTVYGVASNPYSKRAVRRLLAVKGRGEDMPPPVLGANKDELLQLGHFRSEHQKQVVQRVAEVVWPGPLTLIIPTKCQFGWDMSVRGNTVAVRVPKQDLALKILTATGPLAVTSANKTGMQPATTVDQARECFGDEVAIYFDGGKTASTVVSTILNCVSEELEIVRNGAIGWDEIASAMKGE